jgi:uncharacterized linocin/CFP29 family protein
MDLLVNNGGIIKAYGDVAQMLLDNDMDPGAMRPFINERNQSCVTVTKRTPNGSPVLNGEGKPVKETFVTNAPSYLRVREWIELDQAIMEAVYTTPMRLFNDLRARGDAVTIPNGMGKSAYEYQKMTDIGPATTSMDGVRESDNDAPAFDIAGIPLPLVHKDFQFTARQIAITRNGGQPLDTVMARLAARKVMEEVEKMTAGSQTFAYGGYNIYGYTNFPARMTQTLTAPSSSNHPTTVSEILSMRKKLTDKAFQGPFRVYMSPAWNQYLDEDYVASGVRTDTLRQRILAVDGIQSVETSYWLTGNAILMVQMTPDVAQAVVGMDVTTLQWPSKGGMLVNFKIIAMMVPLLRADINSITGIVHGS